MIYRQLLICLFLLGWIALTAKALPPPSPAGGRMLRLDETHDFLGTDQAWFADQQFKQLTVEAWVYLEELPQDGTFWSIIGQEGRFCLVIHGGYGGWIRHQNAHGATITSNKKRLPTRKWLHIALLYNGTGVRVTVNGDHGLRCCGNGHLLKSDKPIHIGGIVSQEGNRGHFVGENLKFRGYLDEVRISNIVRYEELHWEAPRQKFRADEHTIALWHFNEAPGAGSYKDESGNGYTLWKSDVMPVEATGKLTTTWAELKH